MAHKVACSRKKCIKSANYFREHEELSSLYTISSHSTSSIHSTEMIEETPSPNNFQNKPFIREKTCSKDTYRKLPSTCTCTMRNGVHQNTCSCYRDYYDDERAQCLKYQSGGAPNDDYEYTKQSCTKPCCPVHQYSKTNHCTNLKDLEESYWAKWKPSKCTQRRRRGCYEYDCPKLREPRTQDKFVEVLREPVVFENTSSNENATVKPPIKDFYTKGQSSTKEFHRKMQPSNNDSYEKVQPSNNDSYQKVQPSPDDFYQKEQPSNNDSYQQVQPSSNEFYQVPPSAKDFYQNVISEYNNQFIEPEMPYDDIQEDITRANVPHSEHGVRFMNQDRVPQFVPENVHDEKLYNELYEEYENVYTHNIDENEKRKSEYYEELYNDMYNEYENELLSRMPSDQTETTETMPAEAESIPVEFESSPTESENIPAEIETDSAEDKTDSITVLHRAEDEKSEDGKDLQEEEEEEEEEVVVEEEPKPKMTISETKDVKITVPNKRKSEPQENISQQKITKAPSFAIERLKGHTYPLKSVPKKQPQDKNKSKNGINRAGSPGSLNYLPAYLLRIAANK